MPAAARLRVYRVDPGASFDGGVIAALERLQLTGRGALLDALFVAREPGDGALAAVDLAVGAADGTPASLLDFRLDPRRRAVLTARTLAGHAGGLERAELEAIGAELEPGGALVSVLEAGGGDAGLDAAMAACGGRRVADEHVDATALGGLGARLSSAARITRIG